uniref:Uncharacterized protein n=1 Tax=Trichogramma kaykai TaxID=54128 RepID=A0ABD2VXE0_9HYME
MILLSRNVTNVAVGRTCYNVRCSLYNAQSDYTLCIPMSLCDYKYKYTTSSVKHHLDFFTIGLTELDSSKQ